MRRVGAATYVRQERAGMQRIDSRPSLAAIYKAYGLKF